MPLLPPKCYEPKNITPIFCFDVFTFGLTFESFKECGGVSLIVALILMFVVSDHHHANVVHYCTGTNTLSPYSWCLQFVIKVMLEMWIISQVLTFIALFLVHTGGDYGHVSVVHP